jgi:hypothetical protein
MKRALMILAVAATPLLAEEPAKTSAASTATATTTAAPATARPQVISAATASPADSPLVAAARRTNRAKKSAIKITNATLGKYGSTGARITTTSRQEPIVMPAPLPESAPTPEMIYAAEREKKRQAATEEASKKSKEDAEKRRKAAAAAERAEEGMYGETDADAGYGDGTETPQAPKEKKPPQF